MSKARARATSQGRIRARPGSPVRGAAVTSVWRHSSPSKLRAIRVGPLDIIFTSGRCVIEDLVSATSPHALLSSLSLSIPFSLSLSAFPRSLSSIPSPDSNGLEYSDDSDDPDPPRPPFRRCLSAPSRRKGRLRRRRRAVPRGWQLAPVPPAPPTCRGRGGRGNAQTSGAAHPKPRRGCRPRRSKTACHTGTGCRPERGPHRN